MKTYGFMGVLWFFEYAKRDELSHICKTAEIGR